MKKNIFLFVILLFTLITLKVKGQNNCSTADTLKNFDSIQYYQIQYNEYWLTFNSVDSSLLIINFAPLMQSTGLLIDSIIFYKGSCNNLLKLSTIYIPLDSILICKIPIQTGQKYYICTFKHDTTNGTFSLLTYRSTSNLNEISCTPVTCFINPDGTFSANSFSNDLINLFYLSGDPNVGDPLYPVFINPLKEEAPNFYSDVCNWVRYTHTPRILKETGNYFLHMWAISSGNASLYPHGEFESAYIRLKGNAVTSGVGLSQGHNYTIDLDFRTPQSFQNVQGFRVYAIDENEYNLNPLVLVSGSLEYFYNCFNFLYTLGNTNILHGQLIEDIAITNSSNNTWQHKKLQFTCNNSNFNTILIHPYQILPDAGYVYGGDNHRFELDNFFLKEDPLPIGITRNINCNTNTATFTINNPIPNIIYNWTVPPSTTIITNTGTQITITWSAGITGIVKVEGSDAITHCLLYKDEIPLYPIINTLTINGSLDDNCHKHGIFSVDNPQPYINYLWNIVGATSFAFSTSPSTASYINNEASINWSNTPGYIKVIGKDLNGCILFEKTMYIDDAYLQNLPDPSFTPITINSIINTNCKMEANFDFIMPINPAPPISTSWVWTLPYNATYTYTTPPLPTPIFANWNNAGTGNVIIEGYDTPNHCLIYKGVLPIDPDPNCSLNVTYIASELLNTNKTSTFKNLFFGNNIITGITSTIYLDGIFTVDENLTFDNCSDIRMGPNAKIIVEPGITLSIINSSHLYACSCPWDGIYVEDPLATVIVNNKSIIQDAKNAIVSINDGNFQISDNAQFVNNLIGILVKEYYSLGWSSPIPHQGFISNTTFSHDISIPSPYIYNNYLTGISVENVFQLTIGDNTSLQNKNKFLNLQYGIKTLNSDINIYNNYFENIGIPNNNPPSYSQNYLQADEAAIYCTKDFNVSYPQSQYLYFTNDIKIGDNGYSNNIFDKCNISIFGINVKPNIYKNNFKNQYFTGIHLKDCRDGINIESNQIDMNTSLANYSQNSLFNSSIIVEFPSTGSSYPIQISNNTINDTRTGVYMTNCVNANINNNNINFNTLYLSSIYNYIGINLGNCNFNNLTNNNIKYNIAINSSYSGKLYGIILTNVISGIIEGNNLENLGTGLKVKDYSLGSFFWCNTFNQCWKGIDFLNAVITWQYYYPLGYPYFATDNIWIEANGGSTINRINGSLNNMYTNTFQWYYYDDVAMPEFNPSINSLHPLVNVIIPIYYNILNGCFSNKKSLAQQIDRTILLEKIIQDSINYNILPLENKYYAKTFAYRYLEEKPNFLNLGTPDDSIYQNFYNSIKLSNIGKLFTIDIYIKNRNYVSAELLNTSLIGINLIETNQIEVNKIYINKLIYDSISVSDSISLVNIAYQEPSTGGKGVYGARVILGLDPYNSSLPQNFLPPEFKPESSKTNEIKIYPNPAKDKLYIVMNNESSSLTKIELYNFSGKLLYSTFLNVNKEIQSLDISYVKSGIYNLRLITSSKIENRKLIVIK